MTEVTHQAIMDRLKAGDARFERIEDEIRQGRPRLESLEQGQGEIKLTVNAIHAQQQADEAARQEMCEVIADLKGLLEWHRDVQGVGRIFNGMSRIVLRIAALAAAIGAGVALFKGWVRGWII